MQSFKFTVLHDTTNHVYTARKVEGCYTIIIYEAEYEYGVEVSKEIVKKRVEDKLWVVQQGDIMQVKVKKMFDDVQLPEYATPGSACFDIRANIQQSDWNGCDAIVFENNVVLGTGLQFEIPENHVMLVFSRSGHGFKNDMRLANCTGIIDADYRGELKVKLTKDPSAKDGKCHVEAIKHGDRIAQGMVIPYEQVQFVEVDELSTTERGEGGFGSTGV